MKEITCPHCQRADHQQKVGLTSSGSQRYLCVDCQRKYAPQPKSRSYDEATRHAIRFYIDGMSLRRIACHLGVVQ